MPCTPEQIAEARRQAQKRQLFHVQNRDPDNQFADMVSGEEVHFRGFLGHYELFNVFGVQVDLEPRREGDGGLDGYLRLDAGRFRVDVKTSTYTGPEPYLRVPVKDCAPKTIYIAARLSLFTVNIELVGWEWGVVMARCPTMSFNTRGTFNYVKPYELLRDLDELKRRLLPEYPPDHPVEGDLGTIPL